MTLGVNRVYNEVMNTTPVLPIHTFSTIDQNTQRPINWTVCYASNQLPTGRSPWTHLLMVERKAGGAVYSMHVVIENGQVIRHNTARRV